MTQHISATDHTSLQPEPPRKKSKLKRNLWIAAGIVAVAAVASTAGNGTKVEPASTTAPATATEAAKAPTGPDKSPRGNLMYAPGQTAVISKGGKEAARITVNEIKVSATCPGSLAAYDKDTRPVVLINATVTTGPDLTPLGGSDEFGLNPFMLSVVSDQGVAAKSPSTFGCVDTADALSLIGAGQTQTGWVAVKTDSPHGHVIFRHPALDGMEWQY